MAPPQQHHDISSSFPADTARMFWRVFPSVMLPIFMAVGDQTIVASALPAIAGALGDVERVSWIVIAYLIASTISAPVYGYLGDVFGRKRLLFFALGVFMTGSIANAFAPSVTMLAASRFLQGIGGGGLMSLSQSLLAEVIPPRERGRYQGYSATIFVTASAVGPVFGALLTAQFGWRAVFFINIPVGVVAFLMALRLANRRGGRNEDWVFDYQGLIYFVFFVVPLLLALENVRGFDGAVIPMVIALIGVALGSLWLLVRQERRSRSPLLPVSLLAQRAIWMAECMIACHGALMTALIAFLPLYLRVTGIGGLQDVGWTLLLFSFGIALSSIVVGRMVSRTGHTMIFPGIGMTIATMLFIWYANVSSGLSMRGTYAAMAALAISMGAVMTVSQVTIQSLAGRKLLGAASGSIQLSRTVGAVFGTALFGAILFATLAAADSEASRMFGAILARGPDALTDFDPARRAHVTAAIVAGFRYAFLMLAGLSAISAALAWFNPSRTI